MVSGCALQPVTNLKMRYYGNGFSALPPQGKDWYIVNNDSFLLEFGKISPDKLEKYHTFITEIVAMKPEVSKVHSASEFPKAVEDIFTRTLGDDRFKLISIKTAPFGAKGSYCSLYDITQEERDNPKAPGVILELTAHGFICLDTSSKFLVNASYSERKPKGSKSIMDNALKQELEGFLTNIVVTPFNE